MTSDNHNPIKQGADQKASKPSSEAQTAREARLAENLRANLRRRKAATRKTKIDKNEAGA